MANKKVLHKRSNVLNTDGTPKAPAADTMDYGELAINYNANYGQLFVKNSNNSVVGLIPKMTSELENDSGYVTEEAIEEKQDKLVAGDNITFSGNTISATNISPWNYYLFEGGSSSSTITIDGVNISVSANTIVEGNFTTDISAISTNRLKRIVIKGDVSLTIGGSSSNSTLETVDIEFSGDYERSFQNMFRNLRALRYLHISGVRPTSCNYMCSYIGYNAESPCMVDVKGLNFSACTNTQYAFQYANMSSVDMSGADLSSVTTSTYMFYNANIGSVDFSGADLSSVTTSAYMFYNANIGSVDFSGAKNGITLSDMFNAANIGSINMSGADFSATTDIHNMFNAAHIGSINMSGANLSAATTTRYLFYLATIGSVDISGADFSTSTDGSGWFNGANIGSVDMSGVDLSASTSNYYMFYQANIKAINFNGVTLPKNDNANTDFLISIGKATSIGAILGDFSYIYPATLDLSEIPLGRQSILAIFSALESGSGKITLGTKSYDEITTSDIEVATGRGWTVTK